MNILFIGDNHIKITKFELGLQFLNWITDVIKKEKPDLVVNLGDAFDTHAVVRSEVMSEFTKHMYECIKVCPYVYLLGNHDMYRPNDAKYHALSHLKGKIPGLSIVDTIQDIDGITYVPYQVNHETFPAETQKICVAHQTFKGADFGDITTQDGVDQSSTNAEIIISGHIHKRQVLDRVIYPGSPFSQSANDIDQYKGVMRFNTETYQYSFIESPMPRWRSMAFEVTPAFTCNDILSSMKDELTDTDHWVVELTGPKAELSSFIESKQVAAITKNKDVKFKPVFTDKEKKTVSIKSSMSIQDIIKEYIYKVYDGSLNKDELNSKSLELLSNLNK